MRNILKEKLARGEKPLGTFVGTGSAAGGGCLGCGGLDFAILDNEHSPIEAETTARLCAPRKGGTSRPWPGCGRSAARRS